MIKVFWDDFWYNVVNNTAYIAINTLILIALCFGAYQNHVKYELLNKQQSDTSAQLSRAINHESELRLQMDVDLQGFAQELKEVQTQVADLKDFENEQTVLNEKVIYTLRHMDRQIKALQEKDNAG